MKKHIGVIGLGKLGLCLALNLERAGYSVKGVDSNSNTINSIQNKSLVSTEPLVKEYLQEAKNLSVSDNLDDLFAENCEVLFVVVATPSLPSGGYDHYQVDSVIEQLIDRRKKSEKQIHLVINCTTMPSYCDSITEKLEANNFSLTYNPEFIAQGSIIRDQQYPDQVLIGSNNEAAINQLRAIYTNICKNNPTFCVMSPLSAEITKLGTNCFLTTKISFANAIGDLAEKVGAETDLILSAIGSDSRIGKKYLNYGFGFGGPCFPRDNKALIKFGQDNDHRLLLSEATDEVNEQHLEFQFRQWMKIPENEIIEFDHVTYKKGTTILEEAQQLKLAVKLAKAGRKVLIHESQEVIDQLEKNYKGLFSYGKL